MAVSSLAFEDCLMQGLKGNFQVSGYAFRFLQCRQRREGRCQPSESSSQQRFLDFDSFDLAQLGREAGHEP